MTNNGRADSPPDKSEPIWAQGLREDLRSVLRTIADLANQPVRRFLTVRSAAVYSDLSEESIRRMIGRRMLTPLRPVKGRVVIDREQLDAVIGASTATPRRGRGRRDP